MRTVDNIAFLDDKVVIIDRLREPFGLALPGGKIEPGESLEAALHRETREETGLFINTLRYIRRFAGHERDPRGWTCTYVFATTVYGTPQARSDAKEVMLLTPEEIKKRKDAFAFDHYEIVSEYLGL